jgi:hypothetical protein
MYARPVLQQKRPAPRKSDVKVFGSPVGGWIANRSLSNPQDGPQAAAVLDNYFPTATSAMLRRGRNLTVTLNGGTEDVLSMFSYNFGNNESLFGATDSGIYNVPTGTLAYGGTTNGRWNTVQFAATGNTYLIGVNGSDSGFIYDGTNYWPNVKGGVSVLNYDARTVAFVGGTLTGGTSGATGTIYKVVIGAPVTIGSIYLTNITGTFQDNEIITASGGGSATANGVAAVSVPGVDFGVGVTSADMSFVWVYKNALYFLKKDSLSFYYLPVDSVGGTATLVTLAGVLTIGGKLMIGQGWSLDTGQQGGLSEQCVFISDEGEVAVYQGLSPAPSQGWSLVGIYRIGALLGDKAFVRAGADLLISTTIGKISLAQAIQRDVAAIAPQAVSYPIHDAWTEALVLRGNENWQSVLWPEGQMVLVSPPNIIGGDKPVVYVVNANTMAWCRFTNWYALSFATFQGDLYFGSSDGRIFQANVTGFDNGDPYTGVYIPLFDDLGAPSSLKVAKMGRAVLRSLAHVDDSLSFKADYDVTIPSPPSAGVVSGDSIWGSAIWGTGVWGAITDTVIDQRWQSIGGAGYAVSLAHQVTSGAVAPLDTEIVRLEMTYTAGELIS